METATQSLPEHEILAILRAADEIIAQGGRTLLAKILKGSREKKVLALELDNAQSMVISNRKKWKRSRKKLSG
ncbi:hypothetical protein ABRT01_00335 [Lentibacillus sp. L22]|uniref:hypothetical protein n=1 Tax=Lentibacillus sp. L22 TaxID=3163028 RepID=UPI0034668812